MFGSEVVRTTYRSSPRCVERDNLDAIHHIIRILSVSIFFILKERRKEILLSGRPLEIETDDTTE